MATNFAGPPGPMPGKSRTRQKELDLPALLELHEELCLDWRSPTGGTPGMRWVMPAGKEWLGKNRVYEWNRRRLERLGIQVEKAVKERYGLDGVEDEP